MSSRLVTQQSYASGDCPPRIAKGTGPGTVPRERQGGQSPCRTAPPDEVSASTVGTDSTFLVTRSLQSRDTVVARRTDARLPDSFQSCSHSRGDTDDAEHTGDLWGARRGRAGRRGGVRPERYAHQSQLEQRIDRRGLRRPPVRRDAGRYDTDRQDPRL